MYNVFLCAPSVLTQLVLADIIISCTVFHLSVTWTSFDQIATPKVCKKCKKRSVDNMNQPAGDKNKKIKYK